MERSALENARRKIKRRNPRRKRSDISSVVFYETLCIRRELFAFGKKSLGELSWLSPCPRKREFLSTSNCVK
jgi:hypothetical protein